MKKPNLGGKAAEIAYYDRGPTPFFACAYDQRFSYCLYAPELPKGQDKYRLIVLVHGTDRPAERNRDGFRAFARAHGALIMAPLFPANISGPGDLSGYKRIRHDGIEYDTVLLSMIDEVRARYPVQDKCIMQGFSGGAHYTHRFLMAHPQQLAGASIGAPGIVTLVDDRHDWLIGTRDFAEIFGNAPDLDAIAKVPVQIAVGDQDTATWEITMRPGDGWWEPGAEWQQDATRIVRAQTLRDNLESLGCDVDFTLVPGVGHETEAFWPPAQKWMASLFDKGLA
mgnify:FL=1